MFDGPLWGAYDLFRTFPYGGQVHDKRIASVGYGSQSMLGSGTGVVEFSLGQQGGIRNNPGCPPNALELAPSKGGALLVLE